MQTCGQSLGGNHDGVRESIFGMHDNIKLLCSSLPDRCPRHVVRRLHRCDEEIRLRLSDTEDILVTHATPPIGIFHHHAVLRFRAQVD